MRTLTISERRDRGVVILNVAGKITLGDTNRQLRTAVERLLGENEKRILLDLSGTTRIDSSGLGEIIACHSTVRGNGGALKLINVPKQMELMGLTALHTVIDIYPTEAAALTAFEKDETSVVPAVRPDAALA